ncbi:MAG: hypothetical protein AB1450_00480 [Pseudomonadota bacterium]
MQDYPGSRGDLLVEIDDPRRLTDRENAALLQRFDLQDINRSWLADETGLTSLTVRNEGVRQHYIPYTNRAINWHADGYCSAANRQIHALNLHVVQQATNGGENAVIDHEIAHILLREKSPACVRALMAPRAVTIPAHID